MTKFISIDNLFKTEAESRFVSVLCDYLGRYSDRVFLVGGCVRDFYLERKLADVDFMILNNLERLVGDSSNSDFDDLREEFSPFVSIFHKRFLTGKFTFERKLLAGSEIVDVAQARKEVYSFSGAEPVVSPGSLEEDILRRDFSVNALYLEFSGGEFKLIDEVGGFADLEKRQVRVLHDESFVDDPARVIRAFRFKSRLGMEMEGHTMELIEESASRNLLDNLPLFRMASEFLKLLREESYLEIISELKELGFKRFSVFEPQSLLPCAEAKKDIPIEYSRLADLLRLKSADEKEVVLGQFGFNNTKIRYIQSLV